LRAALQTAAWVSVDDTGARHAAKNGFCTQIGNDDFAWFGTRTSKSRLNFLDLLRAGHTDFVINQAALDYMRGRDLAGPVISQLATHQQTRFADQAAWQSHLDQLGISAMRVTPDPICIATEGALWGSVQAHGLLREMVIVSDDAGQFDVGHHALCWVHAERLVHKLDTFTDLHRTAQQRMRTLIWRFYDDLKEYRAAPTARRRGQLRARFDRIFHRRTGFVTLDRLLARLHANKPELRDAHVNPIRQVTAPSGAPNMPGGANVAADLPIELDSARGLTLTATRRRGSRPPRRRACHPQWNARRPHQTAASVCRTSATNAFAVAGLEQIVPGGSGPAARRR
jgi:hypothetical protein